MNFFLFSAVIAMFLWFSRNLGLKYWWLPSLLWSLDRFTFWAVIPYTEVLFLVWMLSYLVVMRKSDSPRAGTSQFSFLLTLSFSDCGVRNHELIFVV